MLDAKTHIINNKELLSRLYTYVEKFQPEFTVLDTETNSKVEKTALLWGIGLCFTEANAFYIVWRDDKGNKVWSEQEEKDITTWLYNLCSKTKVIGHNIIYDVLVLENNLNIAITDFVYHDTILSKHCVDEEKPFGLKECAIKFLGEWANLAQEELKDNVLLKGGSWTEEAKDMYLADTSILGKYCCWDVLLTFLLFKEFDARLTKEGLADLYYKEEIMPLYREVTINMKRQGFPIDVAYFEKLSKDVLIEIDKLEDEIIKDTEQEVYTFSEGLINKEVPVKNSGNFPKKLAEILNIPLPIAAKTGKVSLAAGALEKLKKVHPHFTPFYEWVAGAGTLQQAGISNDLIRTVQKSIYLNKKNADKEPSEHQRYAFNLNSNQHLAYLICTKWGIKPLGYTAITKEPQIDDDFLETLVEENPLIAKLVDYKKLNKLSSTYIQGILRRQVNGRLYTSLLQFGTTSGRYSSRNPNLQNLPRVKEDDDPVSPIVLKYTNSIRKGLIAGESNKIIDADYSALEPRCFSSVTGDKKLIDVWNKGEDLYSRISIDIFKVQGVSANPKDKNYLKNIEPAFRQKAKVIALAIPYGSEASRVSDLLKCNYREAQHVIDSYLNSYPGLKSYMLRCDFEAKKQGYVKTQFGRVRHLSKAAMLYNLYGDSLLDYKWANSKGLTDQRRVYKNQLNNAKNVKIQGLAASVCNRSMIEIQREFKKRNLNAYIALMIHDQIVCIAKEENAQEVSEIMQDKMEHTVKLNVPLVAEPKIADNLADSH